MTQTAKHSAIIKTLIFILSYLFLFSCNNTKYSECDEMMAICSDSDKPYCLFGFDFNSNNPTKTVNNEITISYNFQPADLLVSTHAEDSLLSVSFDQLYPFAQQQIKRALKSYESIANIQFVEKSPQKKTDLKFYAVDQGRARGAVAFPNFHSAPCKQISGSVFINSQISGHTATLFYVMMLHEIGHSLGLGHVKSDNIMNQKRYKKHTELQSGDSLGIIHLYGERP